MLQATTPDAVQQFQAKWSCPFLSRPVHRLLGTWVSQHPRAGWSSMLRANACSTPPELSIPVTMGGDPLVRWEEPAEAWSSNLCCSNTRCSAYQEHVKWRVHSSWFNQPWLREMDPEPTVKMNPVDATVERNKRWRLRERYTTLAVKLFSRRSSTPEFVLAQ